MNERSASRAPLLQLLLAPLVILGLLGSVTLFGRRNKKQPVSKRAARKLGDLPVQQAIDSAQQALNELRSQVATPDVQSLKQQMAQRAGSLVVSARGGQQPALQSASERAREVASDLGEIFKKDVAPVAKEWAQDAVQEAEEIFSAARQKAGELTASAGPAVKETAPELGAKAGAAAGLMAGTAASAAQALSKRATNKKTKRSLNRAGKSVGQAVSSAGHQTSYVATQSFLVVFWLGALGTVVYYALLSPQQREKVRNFLMGAATQIQDVVADFQSVNGELPQTGPQQHQHPAM
ncbi:MAG TPA: hypothetical protein VFI42_08545 [Thermomicrobiaceae bacterium]|nr:hypothetical protein [Thermomicrobiaceae bacterium]